MSAPPKLYPALLGGAVIGVLSALPLVNIANCCCLWMITGGVVAAYVMQQNHPYAVTALDGAVAGFLAGVIGAVVWLVVAAPLNVLMAPFLQSLSDRLLQSARDVPPEVQDAIQRFGSGTAGLAIGFVMNLFLGMIFASVGGVLGALFFAKGAPPAAPPGGPGAWMPAPVPGTPPYPPPAPPPPASDLQGPPRP